MNWYLSVFRNFADFSGRARRKEYWMFALFNTVFVILTVIIDNLLGTTIGGLPYGLLYLFYAVIALIPSLAVVVRRLHDVGKSGWMILISLIPIVGAIWLFILMVTPGNVGENKYGEDPKGGLTENSLTEKNNADKIILALIIWMVFTRLFWLVVPKLINDFFDSTWFKFVGVFMDLVWAFVPIALAFVVKDKTKQTVIFVLGGIYAIFSFYQIITRFLHV